MRFQAERVNSANFVTNASGTRYFLPDHLNSTNVTTNASGTVIESLDYYPYGSTRIDTKSGGYGGEKRKYAGNASAKSISSKPIIFWSSQSNILIIAACFWGQIVRRGGWPRQAPSV
jgi:hypothetical protein